jgi:hypothetical protein
MRGELLQIVGRRLLAVHELTDPAQLFLVMAAKMPQS